MARTSFKNGFGIFSLGDTVECFRGVGTLEKINKVTAVVHIKIDRSLSIYPGVITLKCKARIEKVCKPGNYDKVKSMVAVRKEDTRFREAAMLAKWRVGDKVLVKGKEGDGVLVIQKINRRTASLGKTMYGDAAILAPPRFLISTRKMPGVN